MGSGDSAAISQGTLDEIFTVNERHGLSESAISLRRPR